MNKSNFYNLLTYLAILMDGLYILWILWNAIDEKRGGQSLVETVVLVVLLFLLGLNIFLLSRKTH